LNKPFILRSNIVLFVSHVLVRQAYQHSKLFFPTTLTWCGNEQKAFTLKFPSNGGFFTVTWSVSNTLQETQKRNGYGPRAILMFSKCKGAFTRVPQVDTAVESTIVNRVNRSTGLKHVGDGQISFNVVDSLWGY
jgi:hypothetical protein